MLWAGNYLQGPNSSIQVPLRCTKWIFSNCSTYRDLSAVKMPWDVMLFICSQGLGNVAPTDVPEVSFYHLQRNYGLQSGRNLRHTSPGGHGQKTGEEQAVASGS